MKQKSFPIGAIISIITGIFVCRDISELYETLDFLTQDTLFTHQLPRASRECAPELKRCFPFLKEINTDNINKDNFEKWLLEIENKYGKELMLTPISKDKHKKINPLKELENMVDKNNIIPVVIN